MARRNERGQSTVEFALTMVLLFGFLIFFIKASWMFAFGNYVHYATFMAARAYLSGGYSDKDEQTERAKAVIIRMLKKSEGSAGVDRFPMIAQGVSSGTSGDRDIKGMEIRESDSKDKSLFWMTGVRYTFKSTLFAMPFADSKSGDSAGVLTLTSESWLGREQGAFECESEMGKVKGIFDNGC